MTVSVYTYHHPQKWQEQKDLYDGIKHEIHITATKNMADGIKDCYRNDEKGEFQYIFTIRQVMSRLLGSWSSPETQLNQYLTLSKTISESSGSQNLKDAFRHNTTELLDTIRSLVFTRLTPNDVKLGKLTQKEEFFHDIWKALELNDSTYHEVRITLQRVWKREAIIKGLNRSLESQFEEGIEQEELVIPDTKTKLILHGFYFVTPEQQIFLKKLQQAGFEIVFYLFYDERFPNTFDFTKAFISKRFDWTDEWNVQERTNLPSETIGTALLNSFEEGQVNQTAIRKQIKAYETFFDFLHEEIMKHYPIGEKTNKLKTKDFQFIATNADILNEILVQYYPENFSDQRNFLNYPVGRFILKIHEMLQEGDLVLNEEILMSTFSSGWLFDIVYRKNARDYTHELKQLFPFFQQCTTVKEWIQRFQDLITQYEQIIPLFESPGDNRVLESIRSPFTKLAYLSLDIDDIKQIRTFILLLEEMATNLFVLSTDTISISEHFSRLANLIREHNPIKHTVLQNEEERLIEKLKYKISQIEDEHLFLYEDIGQAIHFYLSGKFSEEEDAFIKPFIEVDGEAFKKNVQTFYVTGLDEQGLPLSEFSIPWPLQEETYALLSENHRVLELNELRNKSVKQISRYLLFIALDFLPHTQLELSWIRNFLDRVDLQPAVYLHQLDLQIVDHKFDSNDKKKLKENPFVFSQYTPNEVDLKAAYEELKYEDILAEYELCQRRFYYGYVLDRYPVFKDEFIHQFIFTEIVKLVKRYTQQKDEEVIELVSELFPQWTDFKKKSLAMSSIGYAGRRQERQDMIMENVSVSETRKNFQFPGLKKDDREKLFELAISKKDEIMKSLKNPSPEAAATLEATPGYNCRFCPHLDYCSAGVFAIDEAVKRK
ncbi:hypothetical protein JOC85_001159 [Bacillus mesophilus]|uniref:NTF2 domain-containing protein n=1 Tax=Bacillus mesophilus TaxID=1808955 RepID=A0A6M0Q444_9BACI|nr:hypothetical protein [Bacillus mesophilus]MBM7660392.1 hypothetical protein [Bacillus mesophilus]NEY71101.1 hypothetical protein [Bacillus mesophilus]